MDLFKAYQLYKTVAPALFAIASAILGVQSALGVSHPTIAGTIATAILGLVGAHAVHAAHSSPAEDEQSKNPGV